MQSQSKGGMHQHPWCSSLWTLSAWIFWGWEVMSLPWGVSPLQRGLSPTGHLCRADWSCQVLLPSWLWRSRCWTSRLLSRTSTCSSRTCGTSRSQWRGRASLLIFTMLERSQLPTHGHIVLLPMPTRVPGASMRSKGGPLPYKALPQWGHLHFHGAGQRV